VPKTFRICEKNTAPRERKAGMTTLEPPHLVRTDKNSQLVVESGHPLEEFVMLKDEHGGIHLVPREFYAEIQAATQEMISAVNNRGAQLRALRAEMPEEKTDGDLSELTHDVRSFSWARQQLNRLFS
jgi:hypothetical protein